MVNSSKITLKSGNYCLALFTKTMYVNYFIPSSLVLITNRLFKETIVVTKINEPLEWLFYLGIHLINTRLVH